MKKLTSILLALALALLLAACGTTQNPPEQPADPGVSTSATAAPTTSKPPTREPEYDMETKKSLDEYINAISKLYEVDIDAVIKEAFAEYGQFFNEYITIDALRAAFMLNWAPSKYSIFVINDDSFTMANDFLKSKGQKPLDLMEDKENTFHKKCAAAVGIAASLYYDPNYDTEFRFNLANAFSQAMSMSPGINNKISDFASWYYVLPDDFELFKEIAPSFDISKYYKGNTEFDLIQCAKDMGFDVNELNGSDLVVIDVYYTYANGATCYVTLFNLNSADNYQLSASYYRPGAFYLSNDRIAGVSFLDCYETYKENRSVKLVGRSDLDGKNVKLSKLEIGFYVWFLEQIKNVKSESDFRSIEHVIYPEVSYSE